MREWKGGRVCGELQFVGRVVRRQRRESGLLVRGVGGLRVLSG